MGLAGRPAKQFESFIRCQKKRQVSTCRFFNEINPLYGICEMHDLRGIYLRYVKCLRA